MNDLRICDKRRYESQREAREMILYLMKNESDLKLKSYKCHICHHWHLTSKYK